MDAPDLSPWGMTSRAPAIGPPHGTNNTVRLVAAGGIDYVWRRCDNLDAGQVRREQRLLEWLSRQGLDFKVPLALPTTDGACFAVDGSAPVTLHRLIPGRKPSRGIHEIEAVARAFGQLWATLASAPRGLGVHDWDGRSIVSTHEHAGNLADVVASAQREVDTSWFVRQMELDEHLTDALAALPGQVTHGDVATSNALINDGVITGLLDFEIAGWDARVNDVVTGLCTCVDDPWEDGFEAQKQAFVTAFDTADQLRDDELALVPELVMRRCAGSVIWRIGRWRQGLDPWSAVLNRMADGATRARHRSAYRI
ncbi:phosphotransferase [Rudaeicoccus suwonensis]|uniref:Ser/Thr protein kinase RdoA (MazF antagonist) n=1 Tax=Rudaeicoccus suwonensis TaxID=657409 RepID=A0A561EBP7_9MICO|nr:phosphotransferase [Rudaeicoccus suwonensis]TWE13035.1 Ser/Thr protein kinase RdoA (MazF antagonist) [Rudaeicoccus suwonensis]